MREFLSLWVFFFVLSITANGWAWTNVDPQAVALAFQMQQIAGGKGGHGGRGAPGPSAQSGPSAPQAGEPARGEPSGSFAPFPPVLLVEPLPTPPASPRVSQPPSEIPQSAMLMIPVRFSAQQVLQQVPGGYQLGGWVMTDRGWVQTIQPQRPTCP